MIKLTRFLLLLLAFQMAVSSCASTKRRDEQSALGKLWHNMNSHYNGYFNAKELMAETLMGIDDQHVDNYTQRLKMFPFLELQNTSAVATDLDVAIEKVAIVVKKHPYSNWVDDSYLLVGQAQLVKQDYESAEKTLRFMVNEFRPRPKRKKSKARKGAKDEPEEEAYVSRRKVESNPAQDRKDRLRARKDAAKERDKLQKERAKAAKLRKKARDKERKERIRARKRGIKLPPRVRTDTSAVAGLENEPDIEEEEEDLGPVGMISIFNMTSDLGADGETYGKKPDSYLAKHRPAFQEGRLWLAWTLIKRDAFDQAQIILEDMRNNRGTFPDVRRRAMAVQAYLYLEQDELEKAIPYLEEAAAVAKERNERARFYYIAGQLYQELGQPSGAASAFEQTIAARPDYELELGARLNLAQNAFLSGSGSAEDALKKLGRMAKEDKNLPYESQILFSMAAVSLRNGDNAGGAAYLQQALASPSAGPVQRTEAYKLLGDLAYDQDNYLPAKLYYDTTLNVMDKGDLRYDVVTERRDQLTGIADALTDIQLKDSLLRIGMLPEPSRQKWATDLFERRRAEAARPSPQPDPGGSRPRGPAVSNKSDFFAYNPQTVKRGKRDFERQWGDRSLTDNWRRSRSTETTTIFTDPGDTGTAAPEEIKMVTEDEIKKLLEGIPTTEGEISTMTIQQSNNWFNLGREYRDQLENNAKSIEAFETLNTRYPGSNGEAESWYYQYVIHKEEGRMDKALVIARQLQNRYPGSKFEKLANEPGYAAELMAKENSETLEYEKAYRAFEDGDYKTAHEMAVKGRATLLGKHPLKARYALLLAMTTGNTQGRQAYINELRQVVSQFENTPEQSRAREILRLLGESGARIPGQAGGAIGGGFKETMKELHYILIVFDDFDTDLNEAKIKVSEFNVKYNKTDRLRTTNVYLGADNKTPVLVVRRLKSGETAKAYVDNAISREKEFLNAGKFNYKVYAVSQSNYREVLKARTVEGYDEWYRENY
ncbi:type IX secretion system periplasmic lipoprotein PorW/SprE [Neolewinella persica]|uniref:type IX secretion system periplasmic lipoprotein PorW/SprE n=1 Tax=Neolewinella persica TaxID=70998 RepID=UPI00146AB98A|nr:tetratricopeptide repeat protein [Neolewinella persica]